jgi:hypothetical protein
MDTDLRRIVYVSTETNPMSSAALDDLLRRARAKNDLVGVTGMLLYKDGDFLQVIEGPHGTIGDLYRVILRDPRHTNVTTIVDQRISERAFDTWSMGFHRVSCDDLRGNPVLAPFADRRLTDYYLSSEMTALKLLRTFQEQEA